MEILDNRISFNMKFILYYKIIYHFIKKYLLINENLILFYKVIL